MAREVISYYNNNGSDVYARLLDCSKSFYPVRHDKLLQKIMSTGLPPIIIRSLMYIYSNSKIQVKWKDSISVPFDAANSVKHGSVLSPILFTLILDDFLFELEKSGDGCRIGTNYYGCVDMLMISYCYVQVLKVYKECLIYVINFLVVMSSYLIPLKLYVSNLIMVSIVV